MKILIVDDEKNVRVSIEKFLKLENFNCAGAENGLSAKRMIEQEVFSAAVVDLRMPGMDGLELIRWINEKGIRLPVIMISAHGEIQDAVEAMKLGAKDYIVKPFDPEELILRLKRVIEDQKLRVQVEVDRKDSADEGEIIGESSRMKEIKQLVKKVAVMPSTVLITGESGVGKEVIARAIHSNSPRSDGPFIGVNIGGIPETLIESELFGYEKGAFTGAVSRKTGMFELASGGTLFLDEIGDMPVHLQVKLLRVLQEKSIRRLGGTNPLPVDARIISATNKDLETKVNEGAFREDLFYRLNVVRIDVPPLRERADDIPVLTGHIVAKLNRKMGKTIKGISPNALKKLISYEFPGNIRELENIMERAFIFSDSEIIEEKDIDIRKEGKSDETVKPGSLKSLEKQRIIEALHRWEGNRTKAASELGITRRTIINKIKEYNIDI